MTLPNGFYPIEHTFGLDNYRLVRGREVFSKYFWNDSPNDLNWPVFIEGIAVPKNQAPRDWRTFGFLDKFPRTVYYGGPITRSLAQDYRKSFEQWAKSKDYAYDTAIVPIQPNASGMRHPSTDFQWYLANESRPPKRYQYIRRYDGRGFHWVDKGFDTMKYADFYNQHPHML
jgi:hypothetical protein